MSEGATKVEDETAKMLKLMDNVLDERKSKEKQKKYNTQKKRDHKR